MATTDKTMIIRTANVTTINWAGNSGIVGDGEADAVTVGAAVEAAVEAEVGAEVGAAVGAEVGAVGVDAVADEVPKA